MTFDEFITHVSKKHATQDPPGVQRLGQMYFNELYAIRPDLSEMIRATLLDPFHAKEEWDPRLMRFFEFIKEKW